MKSRALVAALAVSSLAIGVSDRDPSAVTTTRKALVRPGKAVFPDRSGPMAITNRSVGEPVKTKIGGVEVLSRNPHVLIGGRTDHHREDVLKILANDVNHPMRSPSERGREGVLARAPRGVDLRS